MNTRQDIYGKEATQLLRDITSYHHIKHGQLKRLYAPLGDKLEKQLAHLVRQGRIFYEPHGDMYHDGAAAPDSGLLTALWVLADFIDKVEYHAPEDFPLTLLFAADGEIYDVICASAGRETLLAHALSGDETVADKRLVIVEDADQIKNLNIPHVTAYCTVDSETGTVEYYK